MSPAPASADAVSDVGNSPHEQPLPAARHGLLLFHATLLMLAFYLYSALFLVFAGLIWLVAGFFVIIGAQYGSASLGGPTTRALGASMKAVARGLRLGRGVDFHLTLARAEAPLLWQEIEALSQQLGVPAPDEVVLENSANAYVWLRGVAKGRGKTRLGLGFDLLAGLSCAQLRGVIAHEIAHARWVRRGYQGFTMRGLARVSRCAGALGAIARHEENYKAVRFVARAVGAWPRFVAKTVAQMLAVCSRTDEFVADRVAAQTCGKAAMQAALLQTEIVAHQAAKIDYRERLLHAEREGTYAPWLHQRLRVADEEKRAELEARALQHSWRREGDTHPILADRLAAIEALAPDEDVPVARRDEASCGLDWLHDASASGVSLLRNIEETAAAQEAKSSRSLAKWMRKRGRGEGAVEFLQRAQRLGALAVGVLGVAGVAFLFHFTRALMKAGGGGAAFWLIIGLLGLLPLVVLGGAYEMWRRAPARVCELPIPPFALYCANRTARYDERMDARTQLVNRVDLPNAKKRALEADDADQISRQNIARGAQLRAQIAHLSKPAARANFGVERAYRALEQCDVSTAAHWARLIFEADPARGEAFLVRYVCSSARGWRGQASAHAKTIASQYGFSGRWALAWIACLEEETVVAEAMLLELVRARPDNATLLALLGWSQLKNGKPREALATRQLALAAAQRSPAPDEILAISEEASHRHTLAFSHMILGQLAPARVHLDWVAEQRARIEARGEQLISTDQFDTDAMELDWQVGHGHVACALEIAERMARARPQAKTHIDIADSLRDSENPQLLKAARNHFERALEYGFYPRAKIALARLAYDRDDHLAARRLLLESVDIAQRREHNADHPLRRINEVVQFLRALDANNADHPAKVFGWQVAFDLRSWNKNVAELSFFCFAPDETGARESLNEILQAIQPDCDWDERMTITRVAEQYQPTEPMTPGVYSAQIKD